jgi:hypothetical protein
MDKNKFYLTASINMVDETEDLKKEVASVINLPEGSEKQPDLSYFSAIFVSSGENLNHAYFLGSELVAAKDTIVSKAMDLEHNETEIIGHIYSSAFTDASGEGLSTIELASTETATLDTKDMHIQIGSVIYKNRFPELSKEIADNDWAVSMECYFTDYDIKVGDMIIPKEAATALGIEIADEETYGKKAKVIKDGKEVAEGTVARVLRGICFSGCGIVKNPANPPSIILETATDTTKDDTIIFNLDLIETASEEKKITQVTESINVTSKEIEPQKKEESDLENNDTVGICVSYKRRLEDKDGTLLNENWCTEFSQSCTATFLGDASDQGCLRNKVMKTAASCVEKLFKSKHLEDTTVASLERLQSALGKAGEVI